MKEEGSFIFLVSQSQKSPLKMNQITAHSSNKWDITIKIEACYTFNFETLCGMHYKKGVMVEKQHPIKKSLFLRASQYV